MSDESDELSAVKAEYNKERREKCLLQVKLEEFESEKKLITCEKERWAREKEILVQGKQWCMREISNRETRINEMRIEMMKLETNVNREKLAMTEELDGLTAKVVELTESAARKDHEMTDLRDRVQRIVEERGVTLNEMDAELRTKERLADLYKTSLEAANDEIDEIKENELRLLNTVQEHEMNIVNLNAQINKLRGDHMKEVAERDATVKSLNEELAKANELLRTGFRGMHRSDDEIAVLSPSAAAASSLMRSGISLTSLYTEHCRVVSELEKKTADNENIERYVTQLVQELKERAPQLMEQKEAYNNALEEIRRLSLQYDLLSAEWNKVQSERDALAGELNFAKTELQRYKHEHQSLSMQVRRLLFAIERGGGSTHEPLGAETEERLFTNICELQQTNVELIRKVRQLEQENAQAIRSTQNSENEALRVTLQSVEAELERIREAFAKSEALVGELQVQCGSAANAGHTLSGGADKATSSEYAQHSKLRADFLQEKLDLFTSDKQEADRNFNERIDQQMEQIFQLRTTNGKLESALEYQKKNQQLMGQNIEQLNKELKAATDEATKLTVRVETLQARNDDLTNQQLNQQQELAQMRVANHTLEEQLQVSRSNEHRANDELSVLRNTSFNAERVALMLQEVETILKRPDTKQQLVVINELQAELELTNKQLVAKEMEIAQLKQQLQTTIDDYEAKTAELNELTDSYDKSQHMLNQMRTIARQYRESTNAYEVEKHQFQTELEQVKSEYEAIIAASGIKKNDGKTEEETANLQDMRSKFDDAERAKTELAGRVAQLETELGDAIEKSMRLDMITSSLNSQREKMERLNSVLKEKDEFIEQLQQQVQALTTISDSSIDLLEQPIEVDPTPSESPSRKRQRSNDEPEKFSGGQELIDKRSRAADDCEPSLYLDVGSTGVGEDDEPEEFPCDQEVDDKHSRVAESSDDSQSSLDSDVGSTDVGEDDEPEEFSCDQEVVDTHSLVAGDCDSSLGLEVGSTGVGEDDEPEEVSCDQKVVDTHSRVAGDCEPSLGLDVGSMGVEPEDDEPEELSCD